MDIGISSACFYPYLKTEDSIALMNRIGFKIGEIFLNSTSEYEIDFAKILLEERLKYDFKINSVHSFSVSFEPYLFDEYKRRRDDSFVLFEKVCKLAEVVGAKCYTFHGMRYKDIRNMDMKLVTDVYNKLTYTAEEHGIKLCQENVFWCMSNNIDFLNEIKDKCSGPLYFTLDIKQAYKAGKLPEDYINVMGERIENFHINDRDNNNICLMPGKGSVDYKKISCKFKEIGYNGIGILEVYRENFNKYSELMWSKNYIEKQF